MLTLATELQANLKLETVLSLEWINFSCNENGGGHIPLIQTVSELI